MVLLATQLPDLIDKPLAWVGALSYGRSFAHSLLIAIPLVFVVGAVIHRYASKRGPVVAFGLSYLSHPPADAFQVFLRGPLGGDLVEASFVLWPLVPVPPSEKELALDSNVVGATAAAAKELLLTYITPFYVIPYHGVQVILALVAFGLWLYDGSPGWAVVRTQTLSRLGQEQ